MISYYQFDDKYKAIAQIRESIKILMRLKKETEFVRLSSSRNIFRNMELAPGYYFEQLFYEKNELLNQVEKTVLKNLFVNFNKIELTDDRFVVKKMESSQCAWAFRNGAFVFSVLIDEMWNGKKIIGNYIEGNQSKQVEIDHISLQEHIEIHKKRLGIRIYEPSPKHKINLGWGTVMGLSDSEAQELLQRAIPVNQEYTHLIAKRNGKYYSFRCHYDNCYHGYWDNTMSEKNRNIVDYALKENDGI